MGTASYLQTQFLGGELSPYRQGRADLPDYRASMAVCRNALPLEEGCWTRRAGTSMAAPSRKGTPGKLLMVDFSEAYPYNIELTSGHMRFYSGTSLVLETTKYLVTAISSGSPAEITLSSATNWATGDEVEFVFPNMITGAVLNLALLLNRQFEVTVIDSTHVTLTDPINEAPLNGALLTLLGGQEIEVARVVDFATPWTGTLWQDVWLAQSEYYALMLHPSVPTQQLNITQAPNLVTGVPAGFSFAPATFYDGPYLDPPTDASTLTPTDIGTYTPYSDLNGSFYQVGDKVTYNGNNWICIQANAGGADNQPPQAGSTYWQLLSGGTSGLVTFSVGYNSWSAGTAYSLGDTVLYSGSVYSSTANANVGNTPSSSNEWQIQLAAAVGINGGQGFLSTDVGRMIRLFSEPAPWNPATLYAYASTVSYGGNYYTAIIGDEGKTDKNINQEPDTAITYWAISDTIAAWTWGLITTVTSTTEVTVSLVGGGLMYDLPIQTYQLGVYCGTLGYPSQGAFLDGRFWLTTPAIGNRLDATAANPLGAVMQFSPTSPDGTVADNNGISVVLEAADVNSLFWIVADMTGLVLGTQAGEWIVTASSLNDPITPTSIQARRPTRFGSTNVLPCSTPLSHIFVQRYGRKVIEYVTDLYSGRHIGADISLKAKHLTQTGVEEVAYVRELTPIIWARTGAGALIGCTYKRELAFGTQPPTFAGWHRHDLGSGRTITSIQAGPSVGGDLDSLAMVTTDATTGISFVELLGTTFDVDDTTSQAQFVDAATPGTYYDILPTGVRFYGLHNVTTYTTLKTVDAWVSGLDCGTYYADTFGSITVPWLSDPDGLFTEAYFLASPVAMLGYSFVSEGQLLRPLAPQELGAQNGPGLGKTRRTHMYAALVYNAQGLSFGTDFVSTLKPAQFSFPSGTLYPMATLYAGTHWATLEDDYSFDSMLAWQVSRPYPATIMAIEGFIQAQDR